MANDAFHLNGISVATLLERQSLKWRRYEPDVIPLWVADMDFPVAPCVQRVMEKSTAKGDYGYALRDGDQPAMAASKAFACRMEQKFGWRVDPADTLVINDLVQALFASVIAFTDPGDAVAMQTPIYPPFRDAVRDTGRRIVANPMPDDGRRFVIDAKDLAERLDGNVKLLFLCNPHNPTGRVLERAELEKLAQLAAEKDLIVISDEIHSDIIFDGRRHIPFASISDEAASRTVTLTSATKSYGFAGLRCGVAHFGSKSLKQRFEARIHPRLLGTPGVTGIDATVAAWTSGEPWFAGALDHLQSNRDELIATIGRDLPEVKVRSPEATYLAWLDFSALDLTETPYDFFLNKARVALSPGAAFDPACERFARLNFATTRPILAEALARMVRAVRGRS